MRLIDALLSLWAEAPANTISVRTLVQRAGAAQAAIHYHFSDIEHLYTEASAVALAAAEGWMAAKLATLEGLAGDDVAPELQASLIASTIADWTGGGGRPAMEEKCAPGAG
ncbi:MAG: TetR family transcriptional regulator, partial [Erythrobacter sp.]